MDKEDEDELVVIQEASFDPDKILCCRIENGHTLVHGSGGRGYGLSSTAITSGCYQWKVLKLFNQALYSELWCEICQVS